MDINSLLHTKWECKYHIVFAPKFRRKIAYGELKQDIANILSTLCKRKRDNRSGNLPGSCAYVSKNSTEYKCV